MKLTEEKLASALAVACPWCGVRSGAPCKGRPREGVHADRLRYSQTVARNEEARKFTECRLCGGPGTPLAPLTRNDAHDVCAKFDHLDHLKKQLAEVKEDSRLFEKVTSDEALP